MREAEYQKIGETRRGEAIYQNLETGVLYIEIDYKKLVKASVESLEGAEFKKMRKKMKIYKGKRTGEGVGRRLIVVQDRERRLLN